MASPRSGDDRITRKGYAYASLALIDRQEREREMREHFESVLALDPDGRLAALREMIEAEYQLDAEDLRVFTESRLRVWLAMAERDPGAVAQIATGYDTVFDSLDAAMAMRRTQTEQQALRGELAQEDLQPLARVMPSVAQGLPKAQPDPTQPQGKRNVPPWKFWARGRN